jgi:hypothetical protein
VKIFWSWQSDTPGRTGRHFVKEALTEAIQELKQDEGIEDAARDELHLDHDVKDIPGTPDLANTIFGKIDKSTVVVADVTPIGSVTATDSGKKLINSNVAIELGYALKTLGWENVISVLNLHYGRHEDLPFDLRHKGGIVTFNLNPEADSTAIKQERKQLKGALVSKVKHAIQTPINVAAPEFVPMPTRGTRARYFAMGEALVTEGIGANKTEYRYTTDRLPYLRLLPTSQLPELSVTELRVRAQSAPMLSSDQYPRVARNGYGAIAFQKEGKELTSSTQFFSNGEIWMIGTPTLILDDPPFDAVKNWPYPLMWSLHLEQAYWDGMRAFLGVFGVASKLQSSWNVEMGLAGLNSVHMVVPNDQFPRVGRHIGPTYEPEIWHRSQLLAGAGGAKIDESLLAFFAQVYDRFGEARPSNCWGFPPSRPASQ